MLLSGLVAMLLLLTAEAKVGNSENVSFCTETDECLQFEPICESDNYEVRHYGSAKWVTTELSSFWLDYATMVVFKRLFNYIKENNVEMTTPVLMKMENKKSSSLWERKYLSMSFLLPSAHQANPPSPADDKVKIVEMPAMEVYVSRFGGWMSAYMAKTKAKNLSSALDSVGAEYKSDYFYAVGYNSPMTMFNRHNEVWFEAQGQPVCPDNQDTD